MDNMNFEQNLFSELPDPIFAPPSLDANYEPSLPESEEQSVPISEQPYEDYYPRENTDAFPDDHASSVDAGANEQTPAAQPQVIEQPVVQVQPIQIPIQPFIAPPIMAPTYMQETAVMPVDYQQPYYPTQAFPAPAVKPMGWRAPPALVFFALLICFPVGLILLLFFTRWGAFAKIFITTFVLLCAWAVYEVLCYYQIIDLPSLLQSILK